MPRLTLDLALREGIIVAGLTNRLREFRERAGLTLERVAESLDYVHSTVQRHEAGVIPLTVETIERYAALYKCSPLALISNSAIAEHPLDEQVLAAMAGMADAERQLVLEVVRRMGGKPAI